MILAESLVHAVTPSRGVQTGDFDIDGIEDAVMRSDTMSVALKPSHGGMVRALYLYEKGVNLANVLARHEEQYHQDVASAPVNAETDEGKARTIHSSMPAKEAGLERFLQYDWHERGLFQDHFIASETSIEQFRFNRYRDEGDFVVEPYGISDCAEEHIVLERNGAIWRDGRRHSVRVSKTFILDGNRLRVDYEIVNRSRKPVELRFVCESNFAMSAGDAFDHFYYAQEGQLGRFKLVAALSGRKEVGLCDDWRRFRVHLKWSEESDLWLFPLYTVSQSESGFEKLFQGAVVAPVFEIALLPEEPVRLSAMLEVSTW
ncbi:MAG: alpha-amylase/4-alpha-glucanotransferase domain-containing protein [Planctomycetota bacterium]|nr:alpha-amylase/4-alpha-glucanotransferase domain-containing protein [Planctomycetota bacterium]